MAFLRSFMVLVSLCLVPLISSQEICFGADLKETTARLTEKFNKKSVGPLAYADNKLDGTIYKEAVINSFLIIPSATGQLNLVIYEVIDGPVEYIIRHLQAFTVTKEHLNSKIRVSTNVEVKPNWRVGFTFNGKEEVPLSHDVEWDAYSSLDQTGKSHPEQSGARIVFTRPTQQWRYPIAACTGSGSGIETTVKTSSTSEGGLNPTLQFSTTSSTTSNAINSSSTNIPSSTPSSSTVSQSTTHIYYNVGCYGPHPKDESRSQSFKVSPYSFMEYYGSAELPVGVIQWMDFIAVNKEPFKLQIFRQQSVRSFQIIFQSTIIPANIGQNFITFADMNVTTEWKDRWGITYIGNKEVPIASVEGDMNYRGYELRNEQFEEVTGQTHTWTSDLVNRKFFIRLCIKATNKLQ